MTQQEDSTQTTSTASERLETAINDILDSGQSLTLSDGTRFDRASIRTLFEERRKQKKASSGYKVRRLYFGGEV